MLSRSLRGSRAALASAAALLATAAPALAGVVDEPIPPLNGQPAEAVFYIPGVQAVSLSTYFTNQGNLDTDVTCISLETVNPLTFTVETFAANGSQIPGFAGPTIVTLQPGQTADIVTEPVDGFPLWEDTNPVSDIRGGSARVISTSPKIACKAVIAPTMTMNDVGQLIGAANLPIIRNDQKGD